MNSYPNLPHPGALQPTKEPKLGYVQWDRQKLNRFKRAYEMTMTAGFRTNHSSEVFEFEGNWFHIGYAKCLIMYLDSKINI